MEKETKREELKLLLSERIGDLENLKLPDPGLLEYYERNENRCIFWNDEIHDEFVDVYHDILRWNSEDKDLPSEDRRPIKIYINSNGGSLTAVFAIIDLIKMSKTPVITIGLGKCYSSGGLLLMAGHKRYILPHCSVLIHDGSTGAFGNTGKVIDNLQFTEALEEQVKQYILGSTKITDKKYNENYRRDWWIMADEAIDYGIADEIVTDMTQII